MFLFRVKQNPTVCAAKSIMSHIFANIVCLYREKLCCVPFDISKDEIPKHKIVRTKQTEVAHNRVPTRYQLLLHACREETEKQRNKKINNH